MSCRKDFLAGRPLKKWLVKKFLWCLVRTFARHLWLAFKETLL
jgi:hypothetical protein